MQGEEGSSGSSPAHPGTMRPESSGEIRPLIGPLPSACPLLRAEPEPWTIRWQLDNWKTQHCSPGGNGKPWGGVEHAHSLPPHLPPPCPQCPAALPEASMQSVQMLRMPSPSDRIQSETLALLPAASPTPGPSLSVLTPVPPALPQNQFHCAEKMVTLT